MDSHSAQGRALGKGIIDIDNDDVYGGGKMADLLNPAAFQFCLDVIEGRRCAGVVGAQPCAPGSLVWHRKLSGAPGEEPPYCPPPVVTSRYSDGVPGLSGALGRELHDSRLIGYCLSQLGKRAFLLGGWFIFESPSRLGDDSRPALFDPTFADHSNVMNMGIAGVIFAATQVRCSFMLICVRCVRATQ